MKESATSFLYDLYRRISLVSGEDREPQFLFQRISVAIQRYNAVPLHDGFSVVRLPGLVCAPDINFSSLFFFVPREYTYRGKNNNNSGKLLVKKRLMR